MAETGPGWTTTSAPLRPRSATQRERSRRRESGNIICRDGHVTGDVLAAACCSAALSKDGLSRAATVSRVRQAKETSPCSGAAAVSDDLLPSPGVNHELGEGPSPRPSVGDRTFGRVLAEDETSEQRLSVLGLHSRSVEARLGRPQTRVGAAGSCAFPRGMSSARVEGVPVSAHRSSGESSEPLLTKASSASIPGLRLGGIPSSSTTAGLFPTVGTVISEGRHSIERLRGSPA